MKKLFGTDGIRGIAYKNITKELVIKVASAIAYIFNREDKGIKVIKGATAGNQHWVAITDVE